MDPARDDPRWGYKRISGEPAKLGITVSFETVKAVLRQSNPFRTGAILAEYEWAV